MVKPVVSRFQVWLVQLNPTQGYEIDKARPCVVISPNEMAGLKTVLIAPMTSKGFAFPCRIPCKFEGKKGLILLDQIRAADKTRLIKHLGEMDKRTQIQICDKMQEMFTL